MTDDHIIIAADGLSIDECVSLTEKIGGRVYAIKIHSAYDAEGPSIVGKLKAAGARRVWIDAKLHDIPNTVRLRTKVYADAGADIVSVHASGGVEMMHAARDGAPNIEVYAITVLTSLSEGEARMIYGQPLPDAVKTLAHAAKEAGMHGIVCSPKEVSMLRTDPALVDIPLIVPGVRSIGKDTHDQTRTAMPREALATGATRLVIGRQITQAPDPVAALDELIAGL